MKRVAFLTYSKNPALEASDALAVPLLLQHGIDVVGIPWDAHAAWDTFSLIIPRSTWDYHVRYAEFLEFLTELEKRRIPVLNPVPVLRWNTDKSYLLSLSDQGVPTVPTVLATSADHLHSFDRPWKKLVIKPAVGASAYGTRVFDADNTRAWFSHATGILHHCPVIIQPFMEHIQNGELSLIFFDGAYSHAVLKTPKVNEFRVHPEYGGTELPVQPDPRIIEQAAIILSKVPHIPLYARVDGIVENETFVLMELELCEPYLFLEMDAGAPKRFADAILKRLDAV